MQRNSAQLNGAMRKYARLVYSLAYTRTQNHADAEDIFQEVFLRYVRRKENFRDEEHEKAWLIRVTANLSVNVIKSAWRRHVTLREFLPEYRNIPAADEAPGAIDEAMRRLREKDRAVLYLRYCQQMNAEEIAHSTGENPETVRRRISRAKKKLHKALGECEKEVSDDVWDQI